MAKSKKLVSAPSVVEVAKTLSAAKEAKYNLANLFCKRALQTGKSAYTTAFKAVKDIWTLLVYVRAMMELDPKAMAQRTLEIKTYAEKNGLDLGDMEMELILSEIRMGIGYIQKHSGPVEEPSSDPAPSPADENAF